MGSQIEDFQDLLETTQKSFEPGVFEDIAADLSDYPFMGTIVGQARLDKQSGTSSEIELLTTENGNARHITETEQVTPADVDGIVKAEAPWRNTITSYFITRGEMLTNMEPSRIVSLVKKKRAQAQLSLVQLMEDSWWGSCASSSDKRTPWGIKNWLVTNATEGFNGGNLSGWSDTGGLDADTTPNWKNWTGQYAAVSATDLVRKMRAGLTKTGFKSPIGNLTNSPSTQARHQLFSCYDVIYQLEEIAAQQNDQLGNDVASMDGQVMVRKSPVQYVPKLDEDTTDLIYALNMTTWHVAILGGEWQREENFGPIATQPLIASTTHNFSKYNFLCRNRRRNAVWYK